MPSPEVFAAFAVASLVSFKNGRPDRANYRRFKIKTVTGQTEQPADAANLAVRNLLRGYGLRMPTGQALAGRLGPVDGGGGLLDGQQRDQPAQQHSGDTRDDGHDPRDGGQPLRFVAWHEGRC